MPKITKELSVAAPIEAVWALVSDMERFSSCVPGCKQVQRVSGEEFDWVLEARVLRTTRKLTARTRTTQLHAPHRAEFSGEGRLFEQSNHYRLGLQGVTQLEDLGGGVTRVRFEAQVSASGMAGALIEKIAAGQMDELFGDFETNLQRALGVSAGEAALGAGGLPVESAPSAETGKTDKSGQGDKRAAHGYRVRLVLAAVVMVLLAAAALWGSR
jgi:carbon monoxide dehydrogenase subunit G